MPRFLSISASQIAVAKKADSNFFCKLYGRGCMLESHGENPWLQKAEFDMNCARRHEALGAPLKKLVLDDYGKIDWALSGWYTLLPRPGDLVDEESHVYTKVRVHDIEVSVGKLL